MKLIIKTLFSIYLIIFFYSVHAQGEPDRTDTAFESLIWKGIPLNIHLKSGTESILRFPSDVQVGLPPDMIGMFTVESVQSSVYITPLSDFKSTRIRFRLLDTNSVMLFDVQSSSDGSTVLLDVLDGVQLNSEQANNELVQTEAEVETYDYADLARFAFQSIYSPERLVKPLPGLSQKSFSDEGLIKNLVSGHDIDAVPASQWVTRDGLYVTAVYLQNKESHRARLDPRRFRHSKNWMATALYSNVLSPMLTVGDATTMVVISDTKWEDSITWLR